jgi:hypothetical protein
MLRLPLLTISAEESHSYDYPDRGRRSRRVIPARDGKEYASVSFETYSYLIHIGADQCRTLNSAIDRLPQTLKQVLTSLHQQTGWSFVLLAGGPTPKLDASLQSIS